MNIFRKLIIFIEISICLIIIFFPNLNISNKYIYSENIIPVTYIEQTTFGIPVNLKIPKININTTIETVGITSYGEMETPENFDNVAWFNLGPRPGEKGTSIIDGHFGFKNNLPAVFNNLKEIKKGDKIYIEDEFGIVTTFIVREIKNYNLTENTFDIFNSKDKNSHLNIITCDGVWNKLTKQYSERLVVFTDKE